MFAGRFAQRLAQRADALGEIVLLHHVVRPDRRHQLVLGDEAAGIAQQVAQHGERLAPHRDGGAVHVAQNLGGEVDLDPVDGQDLRRRAGHTPPPGRAVAPPLHCSTDEGPPTRNRRLIGPWPGLASAGRAPCLRTGVHGARLRPVLGG